MAILQGSKDLWDEWGTTYYAMTELPQGGLDLEEYVAEIETTLIKQALQSTRYSQKRAADLLGLTARSLRYRLKKYGLADDD
jgi:two-component system response regulator PilR (NtrC family)